MSETMIHRKTKIDPETTGANRVRPTVLTASEKRQHLAEMRRTAQEIRTGQRTERSVSPRQARQYGRYLPTLVGLRFRIGYMRTVTGWGRTRVLTQGALRESWTERKQEMHRARTAERIRARRRVRRVA